MNKIKVAIYSGTIPSTTFIENLIKAVAENDIEVLLFGESREEVQYKHPGIKVFKRPTSNWLSVPSVTFNILRLRIQYPTRYQLVKQHIDKQNPVKKLRFALWQKFLPILFNLPDVFHLQWAKTCDEWMFLKELFNVKIICSLRGAQIHYQPMADFSLKEKYTKIFPKIDGFHAVCKDIAQTSAQFGASSQKTKVIYSGIDLTLLNAYLIQEKNIDKNTFKVISIGRMHWNKGYHFALDALKKLIDSGYNLHYTIIAGLNQEEILYQIADLELQKHVTLLKSMPQENVFELMQKADLLLLPSFEEGIANVVLEAMAIGLPVLSSDCGGMPEVISHNITGYLFRNRDQDDLMKQFIYAINNPDQNRQVIIEKAKQFVKANHDLKNLGLQMSLFYEEIYNQRG